MTVKIIQDKLRSYQCNSQQEEEHALKEITQELILYALYQSDFFKRAAFQGGTCLRILYGLNRFSEDLDFALLNPDPDFQLSPYLKAIEAELAAYGYAIEIDDRATSDSAMRSAFLKDDSLGKVLNLDYPKLNGPSKTIKIKLEVDTRPPAGAQIETKNHDFPIYFPVTVHDKPSLFAGKSHALLCRTHIKGRDWYDYLWYVRQKSQLNFSFLSEALKQVGPWKSQKIVADMTWYREQMTAKIRSIDWQKARNDVSRFLRPADVKALEVWNEDFFLQTLSKL